MLALTACTGGGGGSAAPSPTHGPAPQALADAARCMRDNGYPEWPDPVRYEDGHWGWPDSAPDVLESNGDLGPGLAGRLVGDLLDGFALPGATGRGTRA